VLLAELLNHCKIGRCPSRFLFFAARYAQIQGCYVATGEVIAEVGC